MKRAPLTGAAFCAALLATNPAHADPVQVRNGQFEAVVSADQMSRIAIEGDKIVEIGPDLSGDEVLDARMQQAIAVSQNRAWKLLLRK